MSPFESKAQAAYLNAVKPEIAKEFAAKTRNMASLPEHVKDGGDKKSKRPVVPKK